MNITNKIPADQANPEVVKLIRARENTYKVAKLTQGGFVVASVALPLLSALFTDWLAAKPYFAFAGLCLLFLDVAFLDRLQKDRVKRGAKLAEEFDTKVLQLPWKESIAGEKVSPEDVREASAKKLSDAREAEIASWYENSIGEVPLQFGRLICQRTNINYDSRLRRRYGDWLLGGTLSVGVLLMVAALAMNPAFTQVVMTFAVPFTPVLAWSLREQRKQLDTAASLENLQKQFRTLWNRALAGASEQELRTGSRELQDAIYRHRSSAPLVFNWVYQRLRQKNEDEAHHAAKELVGEAKTALAVRSVA